MNIIILLIIGDKSNPFFVDAVKDGLRLKYS